MAHRLENHPRIRASDVKKRGWKAVSTLARDQGPLVVTNHSQAEVVVIDAARYQAMVERLEASDPLEALKRRFDQRLERLEGKAAGDALAAAIDAEPEELAHAANQRVPDNEIDDDSDEHAKP
jgi:PHD/YefM family antitoxin component YafN of YafNO toxin-antitoxin module